MSLSLSYGAFTPEVDVLDRALDSPNGIRLAFPSQSACYTYRHRLNHTRTLDRQRNRVGLDPDHPAYGTSRFDPLTTKLRQIEGKWYLEVKLAEVPSKIEPIPEDEEEPSLIQDLQRCLPSTQNTQPDSGTKPSEPNMGSGSLSRRRI